MVAVGGAGGRVDKTFHARVTDGHQHVDEAREIGLVGREGVFDRAWHRAQGGVVQHAVHAVAGTPAIGDVAYVALDVRVVAPRRGAHRLSHLIQIVGVTGCVIIEPHDLLAQLEQCLQKIGADKTGDAGDEPAQRAPSQLLLDFLISGNHLKTQSRI